MKRVLIVYALLLGAFAAPAMSASSAPAPEFTDVAVRVMRVRVSADVGYDEAVESLKLRANQHNLKYVGANALYKEIEALTGKPARRMEIFNFCDGLVAQRMIAANPLLIAFMPCRVALLEDNAGMRWIVAMMMGDAAISALPVDVRKEAERIMDAMRDMMLAAAGGDL